MNNKILYYVIDKDNNQQSITVYELIDNKPIHLTSIEDIDATPNLTNTEHIQNFLNDNGFSDDEYTFVRL